MTASTKLNPVQSHLLSMFGTGMGEQELADIQQLLLKYYQEKIEREVDAFWEKKQYNQESFKEATTNLHLRTNTKEL